MATYIDSPKCLSFYSLNSIPIASDTKLQHHYRVQDHASHGTVHYKFSSFYFRFLTSRMCPELIFWTSFHKINLPLHQHFEKRRRKRPLVAARYHGSWVEWKEPRFDPSTWMKFYNRVKWPQWRGDVKMEVRWTIAPPPVVAAVFWHWRLIQSSWCGTVIINNSHIKG